MLGAVCCNKVGGYNASVPRRTFHLEGFPRSCTHAVCRSLPGAPSAVGESCSLISAGCVPLLPLAPGTGWSLVSAQLHAWCFPLSLTFLGVRGKPSSCLLCKNGEKYKISFLGQQEWVGITFAQLQQLCILAEKAFTGERALRTAPGKWIIKLERSRNCFWP